MKGVRYVFIALISLYVVSAVLYRSVYDMPPPISKAKLALFHIDKKMDAPGAQSLSAALRESPGINGCHVNPENGQVSVIFKVNQTNQASIAQSIQHLSGVIAQPFRLPEDGSKGCPYHRFMDRIGFLYNWF